MERLAHLILLQLMVKLERGVEDHLKDVQDYTTYEVLKENRVVEKGSELGAATAMGNLLRSLCSKTKLKSSTTWTSANRMLPTLNSAGKQAARREVLNVSDCESESSSDDGSKRRCDEGHFR